MEFLHPKQAAELRAAIDDIDKLVVASSEPARPEWIERARVALEPHVMRRRLSRDAHDEILGAPYPSVRISQLEGLRARLVSRLIALRKAPCGLQAEIAALRQCLEHVDESLILDPEHVALARDLVSAWLPDGKLREDIASAVPSGEFSAALVALREALPSAADAVWPEPWSEQGDRLRAVASWIPDLECLEQAHRPSEPSGEVATVTESTDPFRQPTEVAEPAANKALELQPTLQVFSVSNGRVKREEVTRTAEDGRKHLFDLFVDATTKPCQVLRAGSEMNSSPGRVVWALRAFLLAASEGRRIGADEALNQAVQESRLKIGDSADAKRRASNRLKDLLSPIVDGQGAIKPKATATAVFPLLDR